MRFENVGYNSAHLSTLSKREFIREVKHHFTGEGGREKMDELWRLIQAKHKPKSQNAQDLLDGV